MVDQYPPIALFKRLTFITSALFHRPNKCIFYSINHLTCLFKYQRNTNASWGKREFFNMANDLPFVSENFIGPTVSRLFKLAITSPFRFLIRMEILMSLKWPELFSHIFDLEFYRHSAGQCFKNCVISPPDTKARNLYPSGCFDLTIFL